MKKVLVGWRAKDMNGWWYLYAPTNKPGITAGLKTQWTNEDNNFHLRDHPEQPEVPWKDSLEPVYAEVE
jgi:hypothetical protein